MTVLQGGLQGVKTQCCVRIYQKSSDGIKDERPLNAEKFIQISHGNLDFTTISLEMRNHLIIYQNIFREIQQIGGMMSIDNHDIIMLQ